jgi:acyl-CoA dehydrogenase
VDTLTYGLVVEELSKASAGVCVMITVHNSVGSYPVALYGSDELKQAFLPRMAAGEIAAFCVTEAGAGSDASALQATARRDGDHYVLDGAKSWVTNGARAAFYVILAREPGTTGHKGTHAFLVERDTPGLSVAKKEDKMGLRASDTAVIALDEARVPVSHRLGEEGEGLQDRAHGAGRRPHRHRVPGPRHRPGLPRGGRSPTPRCASSSASRWPRSR